MPVTCNKSIHQIVCQQPIVLQWWHNGRFLAMLTHTRAHAHTRTRAHAHTRTRAHAHTRTRAHAQAHSHSHTHHRHIAIAYQYLRC